MIPSVLQLIAAYLEERGVYLLWSTSTGDDEYVLWANNHGIAVCSNGTSVWINIIQNSVDLHSPDSLERIYEMVKTPANNLRPTDAQYSIGSGKIKTAYSAIPQKVKKWIPQI
jgi:hypothetical protein